MDFKNPKVPEGINVSRHNPLLDLVLLTGGVVVGFAVLGLVLVYLGAWLARYVPVSWEMAMADGLVAEAEHGGDPAVRAALQDLADRLSVHMDLPEGMTVTVHYLETDTVNAFATFGGHVFLFRGLIRHMPNENALAMVLAHEIAHAANRDPMTRLGGTLLLQLAVAVVLGSAPESMELLVSGPNALLMLGFSREDEADADADALAAVAELYGHVAYAAEVFEIFLELAAEAGQDEPPEILSSHPLNRSRITAIAARAEAEGWPLDGDPTPLPPVLAALRDAQR